jgi:hypothetical protein
MNEDTLMRSNSSTGIAGRAFLAFLVGTFAIAQATLCPAAPQEKQKASAAAPSQKGFATPDEAAKALIQAAANFDLPALLEILGPDGEDLVSSEDPVLDKKHSLEFAARAQEKNSVSKDPSDPDRAILSTGNENWPLPIPIVKRGGKWYFDSKAGHDEILYRRIGTNELDAIQVCRGYVEAQREYSLTIHDNSGIHQYAQRVISTPGKQDGLYWTSPDGTPGGPIAEPVARAIEEGYKAEKGTAYHGYYFKILKGQGPAAPLGQLDYVIQGVMIGGFALVAVPAEYRVTGVQTFIVSNDGIVYQKDLGPDSLNIVKRMERYNPDKTWTRTEDEWPADAIQP